MAAIGRPRTETGVEGNLTSYLSSIRICVVLAAAAVMAACAPVTQIDPPQLHLEPSAPYVTNIKVENGSGDVFYDGQHPGEDKEITARPTPEQLDGKMTITRTYSDGNVKKQTLTYEAGKPVNIGYSDATNSYYVKEPPKFAIGISGAFAKLNPSFDFVRRPDTDIIRRESGGATTGFVKGDNDSQNPAFNGSIGYKFEEKFFGAKVGVELQGYYYTSQSTTNFDQVPANGGQLAIFGPVAGGGIATANDLMNVNYTSDYTMWNIQPRFTKAYGLGTVGTVPVRMNSYLGFNYGKNEDDEDLTFDIPGAALSGMTHNAIDNWYYGPELGFYSAWQVCPMTKITLGGYVNFNVNELSADRSLELTSGLTGSDELSDTKFTVGGGVTVGANFKLNDRMTASVGYNFDVANNAPAINVNQQTGAASVDTDTAQIHRFMVGLRHSF